MSNKFLLLSVLSFFMIFNSCKKKDLIQDNSLQADQVQQYIKGDLDSVPFNYTYKISPDTFFNAYYYGPNQNQINLIRADNNPATRQLEIYFMLFENLDSIQVPIVAPSSAFPGNFYIQLSDFVHHVDTVFSPTDNYNYKGTSITATITGKSNDILTGNFSGQLETMTGLSKTISNGEFQIKILRKHNP